MASRTLAGRPRTVLDRSVDRSDSFWSVFRGWVEPIDTEAATDNVVRTYNQRVARRAARDDLVAAIERWSALQSRVIDGWDDPTRTPNTSRRPCWTRCPITGDAHQQPFRDLIARGCTCTVCARVRARQDLCAMAEAADRPWIVDELLEANPDLNPWTIGGDSRQLVTWKCHRCGTVDAASPHSRLTSTTGVLPCCRALAKERTTDGREKKSRKAPAVHQRATAVQLQALREQSLGTIGLRTPTGGSVTVAGAPILFETDRGRVAVALTTRARRANSTLEPPRTAARIVTPWAVRDIDGQWHGGRTGLYARTDTRSRIAAGRDSIWTYLVAWCGNQRHPVQVIPVAEALRLERLRDLVCDTCAYEQDRHLGVGSVHDLGTVDLDWGSWRKALPVTDVERHDPTVDTAAPLYPVTTRRMEPRSALAAVATRRPANHVDDDSVEAILAAIERGEDFDASAAGCGD